MHDTFTTMVKYRHIPLPLLAARHTSNACINGERPPASLSTDSENNRDALKHFVQEFGMVL